MAYKKYKKQYKRWQKRHGGALSVALKALSIAKTIQGFVNTEIKKVDITYSVSPSASTGSICLINGIPQGDATDERNGNSVRSKYINIKGKVNLHASAANTSVRVMLVLDKEARLASMTTTQLLLPVTNLGFRNTNNLTRFVVLKDFNMNVSSLERKEKYFSFYKKLSFRPRFEKDDAGGTIASIQNNALYIVLISDEATNAPTVAFQARYGYIDN